MQMPDRRRFLKVLGGAAAGAMASGPVMRALADGSTKSTEYFVFIHVSGGWDVTLWSDPRNEEKGIVDPASTDNSDTDNIAQWVDGGTLSDGSKSFKIIKPAGSNIAFGPGAGDLVTIYDRICLINGISMNTVSHPDGTAYSATGRHLAGGRPSQSSIDTMVGNELGVEQLLPIVSVLFPSSYQNTGLPLDPRAVPLRIGDLTTVSSSLNRALTYDTNAERDAVTAMLSEEAQSLAKRSHLPDAMNAFAIQYESLRKLLGGSAKDVFSAAALQMAQPGFNYKMPQQGSRAINAAFAIEAMKKDLVRCVSFQLGSVDTHNTNYQDHAAILQDIFGIISSLLNGLDAAPHPTLMGKKLSDHTHILVISDFCRTPQINVAGGRDHYPNNSALVISPKFKSNLVYGSTDTEQLLPQNTKMFSDGTRPISPPDILATFLTAQGIKPGDYLREGESVPELLKG